MIDLLAVVVIVAIALGYLLRRLMKSDTSRGCAGCAGACRPADPTANTACQASGCGCNAGSKHGISPAIRQK